MKTKEQKALAIAEAEGWEVINTKYSTSNYAYLSRIGTSETQSINYFLTYNGLMPIVFKNLDKIDFCYEIGNPKSRWIGVSTEKYGKVLYDFPFQSEQEFLNALLDAVYYVLVEEPNE